MAEGEGVRSSPLFCDIFLPNFRWLTIRNIYVTVKEVTLKQIETLMLPNGREPFSDWLKKLNTPTRAIILSYVNRVAEGFSKKNIRSLGGGVFEIKINTGPGYRVYFGEIENRIILLLLGGQKRSQQSDIARAKQYWRTRNV